MVQGRRERSQRVRELLAKIDRGETMDYSQHCAGCAIYEGRKEFSEHIHDISVEMRSGEDNDTPVGQWSYEECSKGCWKKYEEKVARQRGYYHAKKARLQKLMEASNDRPV